jgi:hypothetical protein
MNARVDLKKKIRRRVPQGYYIALSVALHY